MSVCSIRAHLESVLFHPGILLGLLIRNQNLNRMVILEYHFIVEMHKNKQRYQPKQFMRGHD